MAEQKNNLPEQDLSQQTKVRREKLAALQAEGKARTIHTISSSPIPPGTSSFPSSAG